MDKIFEQALGIESPWFIETKAFNVQEKRLDITINLALMQNGWVKKDVNAK